ncbi:MAG: Cna B-type domain-containing protein [Oscillospiraceae bacterium]|nr:Cna B-type domain-containing protein [Oscillospiraceae bacterium]
MKRILKSVMATLIAMVICMSSMLTTVSFAEPQKNNGASVFAAQGSAVIEGVKVWEDDNDAKGLRPESITVELYKDGEKIDETEATAASGWEFSFKVDSYLDANGEPINYTVKEQPVENYEQTALTNPVVTKAFAVGNFGKYTPNDKLTISVSTVMIVIKKGNDWTVWTERALSADEQAVAIPQIREAGNIGENASIEFYTGDIGNGITIDTVNDTITFSKTSQWSWLLAGEMSFATASAASITNTLNLPEPPATITVEGRKTWNDDNDRDGKRPESIIINLFADGEAFAEVEVTEADG